MRVGGANGGVVRCLAQVHLGTELPPVPKPSLHKPSLRHPVAVTHSTLHSRGNGHQELVEAPEQDVGAVTEPDVVRVDHEQQQTRLQHSDHADDQLGPEVPADFNVAGDEGRHRTCRHGVDRSGESRVTECDAVLRIRFIINKHHKSAHGILLL